MTEEKKLFVRKTSGLVKTISSFGAMVFGVHCISLSSSGLIPYAWVPYLWPGSDLVMVLTIAMIFCLFHSFTYSQIGAAMPRSGADYTLASRIIHPAPAFAASWTLVIFSALVSGSLIAWIPSSVLPSFLRSWGIIFNDQGMVALSSVLTQGQWVLILGTVFVFITWLSMSLSTQTVVRILNLGFFLGVLAWIIILVALASAPGPEFFKASWDRFMGAGNYEAVIPTAVQNGLVFSKSVTTMTLAGLIMGFWIYYGYYIPTFFAGELKEASKTLVIGGWGSLILTWAIFTLGAVLLQRLTPPDWLAAEGYLFYAAPSALPALPFMTFYANILMPNPVAILIIFIAFVYTLVNLAMTYFFYCSRITFAWAFDRVMPGAIAHVSERFHSPIIAVSIVALIAELGVYLSIYTTIFVQINFVLFAVITMLVPVTAAIILPFRRKDLWERGPSIVRAKLGGAPLMSLVGIITMGYLLWMIAASFLYPAVGGYVTAGTLSVLGGLLVSGAIVFYIARAVRLKKEGLDLMLTFKEIPPI